MSRTDTAPRRQVGTMFTRMQLNGFLSFGPQSAPIDFCELNVIVGPNGSGKSNLIEAFALLRALPKGRPLPTQAGTRNSDWFWNRVDGSTSFSLYAYISQNTNNCNLIHSISFLEKSGRIKIQAERIFENSPQRKHYFDYLRGAIDFAVILDEMRADKLHIELKSDENSVLQQIKDPLQYASISWLASKYEDIKIYRDWQFGRLSPARLPQPADAPADFLEEDGSNLGLILNQIRDHRPYRDAFLDNLRDLYPTIVDFDVRIVAGTVQVTLEEQNLGRIPATRLSDGTLRYMCLLAILLHPTPPPLVCIEEPELGLHPDVQVRLARLLTEASSRMQLIVTTHSDVLLDALSDTPEAVLICEKHEGSTVIRRLNAEELAPALEEESLGQLWRRGVLGGNRW